MIPEPRANTRPRKDGTGRTVGVTAALRTLNEVGSFVEVPRAWETVLHVTAARIGITVTTRRLGSTDTTTVYRTA